jgi:uroporphyrinogen-III synthase
MAAELPIDRGDRVLVVRGDLAGEELARALRLRGAAVDEVVAYRTREAPESSRPILRQALAGRAIAAVLFTSGSTVRGLAALARHEGLDVAHLPAICIGPETAGHARGAGFRILAVSPTPQPDTLVETTLRALANQEGETR